MQKIIKKTNSKGFTLIELLVVIAIIGILAGIVLVSLNNARQSARDTQRVGNVRNAQLAVELYFDSNGQYPAVAVANTCENAEGTGNMLDDIGMTGVSDPTAGQNYQYGAPSATAPTDYVLVATLEDTGNSALDTDVDGTVFGCSCDDPNYCVQP